MKYNLMDYVGLFYNKDLIICDLDGTLIDSVSAYDKIDSELIKLIAHPDYKDLPMFDKNEFWYMNGKNNMYDDLCLGIKEHYHSEFSLEEIIILRNSLAFSVQRQIKYKPFADIFLREARKEGYKLSLATLSLMSVVERYSTENENMMKKCILKDMFDYIATFEDVKEKKPSGEIYNKILEHFNISERSAIVLEDSLDGVISANKAGIDVICINESISDTDRKELERMSLIRTDFEPLTLALKR